jgi:membrane-associated protease RseP (regulator of RpoE activity)
MTHRTASGLLAAASLAASALIPATAFAQPVETGIRVTVASRLPQLDAEAGGFWYAVPAGTTGGKWTVRGTAEAATVPPGEFDLYWIVDADHLDTPVLVAEDVAVQRGTVTEVHVQTGLVLEVADWVPPLDPAVGRVIAVNWETDEVVNWTVTDAMVLPPATYALYWDADVNDDERAVWVGTHDVEAPFSGVGLELRSDEGIRVVRPATGGPAEAAGVRTGDVIVAVDGTDTTAMSLEDTVNLIRGPSGTPVELTIEREGATAPLTITVQRSPVEPQNMARIGLGIRLSVDPAVPPLGPGGWWGVTFAGGDPADPDARTFAADETLLVGHTTYDVYWTADGNAEPRLIAADVDADAGIVEVTVRPEAGTAPAAAPPKPRPG